MTPDQFDALQANQAYIQVQLNWLFLVLLVAVGLMLALLASKVWMHAQVYAILKKLLGVETYSRAAKDKAEVAEQKLDTNAAAIQQAVKEVPEKVVRVLQENTPSAGDGDLPKPPLPVI